MTEEELAKLCIESYVDGHKNAISEMICFLSGINENQEKIKESMIETFINKLRNK